MGNVCRQQCGLTACLANNAESSICESCCVGGGGFSSVTNSQPVGGASGDSLFASDFDVGLSKPTRYEVLHDLERAEKRVHRRAFKLFDDHHDGLVPQSHLLLRFYIVEHTAISEVSLDSELARVADANSCITAELFSRLMQQSCLKDNESAVRWARVSCSHIAISAIDCRKALKTYLVDTFGSQARTKDDEVLDIIMKSCELNVSFDEWDDMLDRLARTVRLFDQIEAI